jgi:hypothetical protein
MEKTWMDIWKEWMRQSTKLNMMDFYDWLSENYKVPEKKEDVVQNPQNV